MAESPFPSALCELIKILIGRGNRRLEGFNTYNISIINDGGIGFTVK